MAGVLESLMTGMRAGSDMRQQQNNSRLAALAAQAYGAPADQRQGLVQQAIGLNPDGGFALGQNLQKSDDALVDGTLEQMRYATGAWRAGNKELAQGFYARAAQGLSRMTGHQGLPQTMDDAAADAFDKIVQSAMQGNGMPAGYQTADMILRGAGFQPGSAEYQRGMRIEAGLEPGYGKSAPRTLTVDINGVPTQVTFDPMRQQYVPATLGGQPQSAPQTGGDLFASLPTGLHVTSGMRTPQHNAEVGGVPNSFHLTGQARDILPPNSPQQAQQVRQWAAQNGMEIIDEGDHWHIEPRGRSPQGGVPIVGRPKEQQAFLEEQAKQDAQIGALPRRGEIEAQNEAAKAMATANVQTQTAPGIEAGKEFGKEAGQQYAAIQEAGRSAAKERARLSQLRTLLQTTYTGPGANALLGIKRAANAFGFNVEGLGEAEAARALSNQLALSLRNPAGGEGMPGAMSDSDRAFLQQSVPSLSNSPQGWRAMVDMRLALADAAVKQAQYAEQLRRQGVPIQDIPGMLQDFANQNPIFNGGAVASSQQRGGNASDPFGIL